MCTALFDLYLPPRTGYCGALAKAVAGAGGPTFVRGAFFCTQPLTPSHRAWLNDIATDQRFPIETIQVSNSN